MFPVEKLNAESIKLVVGGHRQSFWQAAPALVCVRLFVRLPMKRKNKSSLRTASEASQQNSLAKGDPFAAAAAAAQLALQILIEFILLLLNYSSTFGIFIIFRWT